jgi:hypothetical protein
MLHNNNYHKDNKKPRTSFTKDIQQREEQTFFDSFPKDIKNIITKLRITVDHIDSPRNYARDLVHELARQLDERRLCERGRISIKIKEILEDKIHAGKVTERWITKCLPREYKREYMKDKRELSSLSENKPGTESLSERRITVGNNGQQTTFNEDDIQELKEPAAESVNCNQQSNPANLQKSDLNPDRKTGTESLSPEQVTRADNTTEPGSMTASSTLSQSIDTHMAEDSLSSGSMDKSPYENCSPRDIRIKKLEDENRGLHIRCQRAESTNTILVLQLTSQGKYINELLNPGKNQRSQLSSATDDSESYANVNLLSLSDKYVGKECTSCLELQDEVTQLKEALQQISIPTADQIPASEFIIPREEYEMVKDAVDKSKSAIFVKCDGSKKFVRALADVDN